MISQPRTSTYQLEFLTGLVMSHTDVAGDILQVGATTWAIHGSNPVDSDVLIAEYDSLEAATAALAQLVPNGTEDDHAAAPEARASRRAWPSTSCDGARTSSQMRQPAIAPSYFLGRSSATWRTALVAANRRPTVGSHAG
jgi:hypothetical protein